MDILALAVFVQAASAGSLAAAARRMKLTPMAVTRRLAALEAELGVRLIHRTTRSVSLTAEGEAFLPFATTMVETAEAGRATLTPARQGVTGLLRVTAPAAFGRKVVAPIMPGLLADNPGLSVDLDLSDGLADLVARGLDVAIRIAPLRDSGLIARRLADNPRLLCAAPAYIDRHGLPATAEDLARHSCLTLSGANHWPFRVAGRERSIRVTGRFSASNIEGVRGACLGGAGLALLSAWDVRDEVADGRLVAIPLADAVPQDLAIWALFPTTRQILPRLHAFLDRLQQVLDG